MGLGKDEAYGLNRWCIVDGNIALGNLRSEEVLIDVGEGEPEELGVEDGGGVSWGLCVVGGPSNPGGNPLCIGDCHEDPL